MTLRSNKRKPKKRIVGSRTKALVSYTNGFDKLMYDMGLNLLYVPESRVPLDFS